MNILANAKAILMGKGSISTSSIAGTILALGTLMQIPAVSNYITPLCAKHPHIASIVGIIVALGTLLHEPNVQKLLGITINGTSVVTTVPQAVTVTASTPSSASVTTVNVTPPQKD